ncbi:MAG: VIT domain-containing protein [Deltaproteobacteria bacterium]
MTHKMKLLTLMTVAMFVAVAHTVHAQPKEHADRTLSPYFLVQSDDPEVDRMPLKSTSVNVDVSGVIADVTVTQVYQNQGSKPLEAIYVFPASTRVAVYGMKMTIGERTITAQIRKREDARREYQEAKQAGQSASLLEQHRPNVFQMNVANILPSDVITVALKYTELLIPTDAVYEFVYPTVVGPRYSNQRAAEAGPSEQWIENPYLHEGQASSYTFNMTVSVSAGLPIQDVVCSSHKVNINYEGPTFASVALDPSEEYGGNRDFLLKYRLAGGKIQTGLLLFEGEEENFFLLMVQPPSRVSARQIPPREYIFIVDVSGSMHGFPLDISKKLFKDLIGNLRPFDRFNVLLFAGGSSVMSEQSLPATLENISHAINLIEQQRGGGGTELLLALQRALSIPRTEGYSRSVVIATDGYVSVEEAAFDLIRNNLGHANMFAFGIGSSVNRYIIEGMARVGMGDPFVITKPEEAPEKAKRFRELIESPVLTDIEIDFGDFDVYEVEPPSVPDVLADRPVIVFGKWRGRPKGSISIKGITGERPFRTKVNVSSEKPLETNSPLRFLWARHRIAVLSDYNNLRPQGERVTEVTNLGLAYNLLTSYTSFVAVDTHVRLHDGHAVTVKQALPLPQGVSDYALGRRSFLKKTGPLPVPSFSEIAGKSGTMALSLESKDEGFVDKSEPATPSSRVMCIELGKVSVTDGLSENFVKALLNKHIPSINLCCEHTSGDRSASRGELVFTLVVDPTGNVTIVKPNTSKIKDTALEQCMVQKLKQLSFPAPKGAKNAVVKVTFVLK